MTVITKQGTTCNLHRCLDYSWFKTTNNCHQVSNIKEISSIITASLDWPSLKLQDCSLFSAAGWHMVSWCGLVWELQDTWRLQVTWLSCVYACRPLSKSPWERLTHGAVMCSGLSPPGNLEIPGNTALLCWSVSMAIWYLDHFGPAELSLNTVISVILSIFNFLSLVILHCWFLAMMRTVVHRYQVDSWQWHMAWWKCKQKQSNAKQCNAKHNKAKQCNGVQSNAKQSETKKFKPSHVTPGASLSKRTSEVPSILSWKNRNA